MKIWMRWLIFLLPSLALAQTSGSSLEPSRFQLMQFKVKGQIENVISENLDQDHLKELILTYHLLGAGNVQRYLRIFWSPADCRYSWNQSVEIEVPNRFMVYDTGTLPSEPYPVIIMLSKNTAEYYRYSEKKLEGPIPLLNFQNQLIQLPNSDRLLYYNFLYDWNQDGKEEILVFQMGSAEIFYHQKDRWVKTTMEVPMEASYFSMTPLRHFFTHSELSVTYRAPELFLADREGDGKKELFAVSGEKLWIYKLNPQGLYNNVPSYKLNLNLTNPQERTRQREVLTLQIVDLDQDGKADLISNYQRGGFFNQKAEVKIFWGKDQGLESSSKREPSRTWNFNGWVIGPFVKDVNADQNPDLIIPSIQFGIVSAAQVLITNNFPFEFRYFISQNHTLPKEPNYLEQINLRMNFKEGRMIGGFPNLFGDFNGDGIDDLLYAKGEQELVVVIKDRQGKRTNLQELIQVPTPIIPIVEDLNGDRKDDIILTYSQDPTRYGEFKVLLNQGKW